jgi:SHS2 domain-containing protein
LVSHTADCIIEAWGATQSECATEALAAVVEGFAEIVDPPTTRSMPIAAESGGPADQLVSLIEELIYALEVFSVVPVRFHLDQTESGTLAGDMEVVALEKVNIVGPAPKAVSYHELFMAKSEGVWHCHVLIDV